MDLTTLYQKRAQEFEETSKRLRAKYDRLALVRLLVFVAGVVIFFLLFGINAWYAWGFALLFIIAFVRFVMWHFSIAREADYYKRLKVINENEQAYLDGNIEAFNGGEEFIDADHPYTVDLDIFGEHSVFQSINRTVTSIGKQELADYLSHHTDKTEILSRQEAIKELAKKVDWRQHFQAKGADANEEPVYVNRLLNWMKDEPIVLGNKLYTLALYIVPLIMIGVLFIPVDVMPWKYRWIFLLIPGYFLRQTMERIGFMHEKTAKAEEMLSNYSQLIAHIEKENFQSDKLTQLKQLLSTETGTASAQLKKLSRIISQLNVRYNAFALVLELGGLWSMQYTRKLERWKEAQQGNLEKWFEALRQFDALSSTATLHYNRPEWAFPEIVEDTKTVFDGEEIGHPLLHPDTRVDNDLNIPHRGHIKLITGSNMGGKSTFLRSTGLAIVMAMMGAPVCARQFRVPLTQVYTSMRTKDALHESTSSFYAELKRLQFIIKAVENGDNIFFLLDEILKGTNSHDRHTGSKALILQLVKHKGSGLIATHDLELGPLAEQHPNDLENLCFEVEVNGDELAFDYKIKPGVSQSLNATILMKRMGINIP